MKNKYLWSVALVALLFVGGASTVQALGLREYQEQVDAIVIEDVDLQQVPDGRHFGTYETNLVSAEAVKDRVIEAQSLDVDTNARATASSKIILKAIEVALTEAKAQ
ncbi:MAG: hypothetical protein ABR590_00375 [Spirochaetia bacterium]